MNSNRQTQPQPPGGMTIGDIYYVLFRHKWKILLLSLAGIVAAVTFYYLKPPPFESQAELLIQYVPEAKTLALASSDQKVIVPDAQGAGVISSEIQILTSLDSIEQTVTNVGVARILAKAGGGSNASVAVGLIRVNLHAEQVDKDSSVIAVTFKHPDPEVVRPVLQEVVNNYFQRHYDIHSAVGQYDDALSREGANLSVQLNDAEQRLEDLKSKANITSLDDARKELSARMNKTQGDILDGQAELAGFQEAIKQMNNASDVKSPATNAPSPLPRDQIDAYQVICTRVAQLRKKELDYLLQGFTKSNSLVQDVDGQIATATKTKADLEEKYPLIAGAGVTPMTPASAANTGTMTTGAMDQRTLAAQVVSLQAKLNAWSTQMDQFQIQATNLNSLAPTIMALEQQIAIYQANYKTLATSLANSHITSALDSGKAVNIKWVQSPSPAFRDWKKTHKTVAMLAFGGIFAGLALAFLIELVLDHTLRRPVEIESKLKVPLFLAIPDVNQSRRSRAARTREPRQLKLNNASEGDAPPNGEKPPTVKGVALPAVSLDRDPGLQPFYEALRDRLVVNFEVRNLTHKPKLVALTSANRGAGVSTIAVGLAASLSETRDGNVLLVDMTNEGGAVQQFYKGKAGFGLDTALNNETKESALVMENLYVANYNSSSSELPLILPKRFAALVPKLKASNYDYIIFDMPPISQTSLTSRLARFMDMVFLVVESEKTGREVALQANSWLAESGATVGAVLNKTHQYVPQRLHQEFLTDK